VIGMTGLGDRHHPDLLIEIIGLRMQDGSMDDANHKEISRKYGIEWLE